WSEAASARRSPNRKLTSIGSVSTRARGEVSMAVACPTKVTDNPAAGGGTRAGRTRRAGRPSRLGADRRHPSEGASAPPHLPAEPATRQSGKAALLSPKAMTEEAPAKYKVKFTTTKGDFVVEVQRDWAPQGADRFYNLVKNGFFEDTRFFRVIKGFMVQFGISGDPAINTVMQEARLPAPTTSSRRRS